MITTTINFPEGLPGPLREGHALQPESTFERTRLASGRGRSRKTFENVPTSGVWDFLFNDTEAIVFEAWFRDQLSDGVNYFNARRKTPLGLKMLVCQFKAMYTGPELVGVSKWKYSCPIEIIERPLAPEGWGAFPEFILQMNILDVALNREWPEA